MQTEGTLQSWNSVHPTPLGVSSSRAIMAWRCWFWLVSATFLTSNCAANCPNEFDVIPEEDYDRDPNSVDDTLRRPLGFKFAIAHYIPTQNQSNPCAYLTNLTDRAVEVSVQPRSQGQSICIKDDAIQPTVKCNQGSDFMFCWPATADKVTFTFYCDPAEGCDTDTQFWYRLTPSVGDTDDWCNARPGDFPNDLIPRPTVPARINTNNPTSGASGWSNRLQFTSVALSLCVWARTIL